MNPISTLHLYDPAQPLIAQHVELLSTMADTGCTALLTPPPGDTTPDVVHVHGCWSHSVARQAERLRRKGARIVLSPHGHLEPWIVNQQRMTEKTAKTLLWQRRLVAHAYALIAHGPMEADALQKLGWNPRIETIRNAVITQTVTPEAMTRQTEAVYRKVMDSNTLEHLSATMRQLMAEILKAGITGDRQWIDHPTDYQPTDDEWRRLLLYAEHEGLRPTLDRGIGVLSLTAPTLPTASIPCYLPENFTAPAAPSPDITELTAAMHHGGPTPLQLVGLDRALRSPDAADDQIVTTLSDRHLTRYFRRLLQLLSRITLLDEGFMPLPPLDDRQTQVLHRQIIQRLSI